MSTNKQTNPYRQFPMRLTAEMFDELDRVSKHTRINKTTISRIALHKFIAQIEQFDSNEMLNEACAV
jgi:predicted DNA-binding protein